MQVAFRELGDTESADEASRNRELIQARSRVLAMASPPQAAAPQVGVVKTVVKTLVELTRPPQAAAPQVCVVKTVVKTLVELTRPRATASSFKRAPEV